jgi:hypothetical protein
VQNGCSIAAAGAARTALFHRLDDVVGNLLGVAERKGMAKFMILFLDFYYFLRILRLLELNNVDYGL